MSPKNRTSPVLSPSATATEIFNFDVSSPTKSSLYSPMVRPRLSMGLGSGHSGATPASCLLRGRATFTARTYGLARYTLLGRGWFHRPQIAILHAVPPAEQIEPSDLVAVLSAYAIEMRPRDPAFRREVQRQSTLGLIEP